MITVPDKMFVLNGRLFSLVPWNTHLSKGYLDFYEINIEENAIKYISHLKDHDLKVDDPRNPNAFSFSFFVIPFIGPDVQHETGICGI